MTAAAARPAISGADVMNAALVRCAGGTALVVIGGCGVLCDEYAAGAALARRKGFEKEWAASGRSRCGLVSPRAAASRTATPDADRWAAHCARRGMTRYLQHRGAARSTAASLRPTQDCGEGVSYRSRTPRTRRLPSR